MSAFVESLRRLYEEEKITREKVDEIFSSGRISKTEYEYIISVKEVQNVYNHIERI